MGLAVQIGEDAYFVRDNAMGVADGVGGWARVKPNGMLSCEKSSLYAHYSDGRYAFEVIKC